MTVPHPQRLITIDAKKVQNWLFERAEMHQNRDEWDCSFEDLYLVTAIFRGDFNPHSTASNADDVQLPSSTNLLLIAHDEWKRREERRHIHEEMPWVHGWISGFLTSRQFVQDRLEQLRQQHQEQP
ncbi:MAG: hypothetical protein EHJ95_06150 [Methanobacteriota archaeon]|nr:MAG: hypothetical protein EHJ95_06150 [Euryarchaeota archaeon]